MAIMTNTQQKLNNTAAARRHREKKKLEQQKNVELLKELHQKVTDQANIIQDQATMIKNLRDNNFTLRSAVLDHACTCTDPSYVELKKVASTSLRDNSSHPGIVFRQESAFCTPTTSPPASQQVAQGSRYQPQQSPQSPQSSQSSQSFRSPRPVSIVNQTQNQAIGNWSSTPSSNMVMASIENHGLITNNAVDHTSYDFNPQNTVSDPNSSGPDSSSPNSLQSFEQSSTFQIEQPVWKPLFGDELYLDSNFLEDCSKTSF